MNFLFLIRLTLDTVNPFGYMPNYDLAVASTAVYAFVTLILTIQSIYYRSWFFVVMTISGISEIVGYAYRWLLTSDPSEITPCVFERRNDVVVFSSFIIVFLCLF